MWDRAGKALKRFWGALSGGKYVAGQTGPVNFENLQPIPVINVMEYGADDGDKAPKLYVPKDSAGVTVVHDATADTILTRAQDITAYAYNVPFNSRLAEEGFPTTSLTPSLLKTATITGTVAGGAGAIAAATIVAAVATKKIYPERLICDLSSNSAIGSGIFVTLLDGAGGSSLGARLSVATNTLHTIDELIWTPQAAVNTLVEASFSVGQFSALADGDTVEVTLLYREL